MSGLRWPLAVVLSVSLCALSAGSARAQGGINREFELKAAFLIHFRQYVTWPNPKPKGPFVIGVLGDDPFGEIWIQQQARLKAQGIQVRQFATADEYQPCQILYIAGRPAAGRTETEAERLASAIKLTSKKPVLLVTDSPGFATKGAMISFLVNVPANSLNMEINDEAASAAGVKISANLMSLTIVTRVGGKAEKKPALEEAEKKPASEE